MHKIVSTLIDRKDAKLAQQWARDVLFQREDFPKESNAAILLVLAAHFARSPEWADMLVDQEWICNDFTLETFSHYKPLIEGQPLCDLALYCHEHSIEGIKQLLIDEVPASFFGQGAHHYVWLDSCLNTQLSKQGVLDRLSRHTMSSGDPDEVRASLVWMGSQTDWENGDSLPVNLSHYPAIALEILGHHQQYSFQDGFLVAMINVHLGCFAEEFHIREIRRLEEMGIPRSFLFIDNQHKRIRLIDDLDL